MIMPKKVNRMIEDNNSKEIDSKATKREERKARRAAKKEAKRIKEENKSIWRNILDMVIYVAVVMIVALFVKHFVGQPIIVDGSSMNDTLYDKDWVWCNKLFYTPKRFDVVIVESEKTKNSYYIKRIIGLPGETVTLEGDDIYITPADGGEMYKLTENYGYYSGHSVGIPYNENTPGGGYKLGTDEYYVMGDNRYNSSDSRYLGGFVRDEIKGHAVFRMWPLNKIGDFDKSNESK